VGPGETWSAVVRRQHDVSRYGEIVERSLVHEGLKHYFLVTFPQERCALRQFLDGVLGPDDDITCSST
jgi:threonine dehydratase